MLYLSTVEAGGRTIFPKLGLSVAPEEGSLLYWHIRWPHMRLNVRLKLAQI